MARIDPEPKPIFKTGSGFKGEFLVTGKNPAIILDYFFITLSVGKLLGVLLYFTGKSNRMGLFRIYIGYIYLVLFLLAGFHLGCFGRPHLISSSAFLPTAIRQLNHPIGKDFPVGVRGAYKKATALF